MLKARTAWVSLLLLAPCTAYAQAQELPESVLHAAGAAPEPTPNTWLSQGKSGAFYGITRGPRPAGVNQVGRNGSVFELSCDAQSYRTIHPFVAGELTFSSVIESKTGDLLGVITEGAADLKYGAVFALTKQGKLTYLHKFANLDGATPAGQLLEAPDGTIYGTTYYGGDDSKAGSGYGVVFKLDAAGTFSKLYDFGVDDGAMSGANPSSRLVLASDGTLFGTTESRGQLGGGTVYKLAPGGAFSVVAAFGGSSGAAPHDLLRGADGKLFGRAFTGLGTIFEIDQNGAIATLHTLSGSEGAFEANGAARATQGGALALAPDGVLYGVAPYGGTSNRGTAFSIAASGQLTILYTFKGTTDGSLPWGIASGMDGNLYGTFAGGNGGIFRLSVPGAKPTNCAAQSALDGGLDAGPASTEPPSPADSGPPSPDAATYDRDDGDTRDAAPTQDAGSPADGDSEGCNCSVSGKSGRRPMDVTWLALGLALLVRRPARRAAGRHS